MDEPKANLNVVSLTLGIIGTVMGVLALVLACFPMMGMPSIAIGIIGLLLSLSGLVFAIAQVFSGIELPLIGCVLCAAAICLSLITTQMARNEQTRARAAAAEQMAAQAQARQAQMAATQAVRAEKQNEKIAKLKADLAALESSARITSNALAIAQMNYDQALADLHAFMTSQPYLTNAVYGQIANQLATAQQQQYAYEQAIPDLVRRHDWRHDGGAGGDAVYAQLWRDSRAAQTNVMVLQGNIDYFQGQLNQIVQTATQFHQDKVAVAQTQLRNAQAQQAQITRQLDRDKSELKFLEGETNHVLRNESF